MTQLVKNDERVVNLDQIMFEEVGQCGRFQFRVIALCALVAFLTGMQVHLYLFTFTHVNTRCVIPECESSSSQVNFTPRWIIDAIPVMGGSFDNCHRFAAMSNDSCSADLFDRDFPVKCEEYVYEHTNTAIFEYKLACDDWRPNLVGSVSSFGHMLALPLGGFIADRWGRRVALILSAFNLAWIGSMLYFANTYFYYVLIAFMSTFIGGSCYDSAYILAVEYVAPKHRVAVASIMSCCTCLGRVLMGLITWTEPYWRNFTLVAHMPLIVTFLYFWIAPESIRWLMSKNRLEEAIVILNDAAKINGNALSEETLRRSRNAKDIATEEKGIDDTWLVCLVFKQKAILLRCLVTPIWWITAVFIFCGLTISSVSISGNRFVNYSLVSVVSIPGYGIAMMLLDRIGRKRLLLAAFWICGACQVAYIVIPKGNYWLSLSMFLFSKLAASVSMTTISVYTTELYPTRYRASLFAFSSTIGTLGSVLAPLILSLAAETWNHLHFAVFGGMGFFCGFLVLLVPETLGTTLPDTIEEAANLGKRQQKEGATKILQPLIQRPSIT